MKKVALLFFVAFVLIAGRETVKTIPLTDAELKANLKKHIITLTSNSFEGRETGTKGEQLAADYIVAQFSAIGLKAKGEKKYTQEFPFTEGANIGKGMQLYVNANSYKVNKDFYPLQFSSSGIVTGYIEKVGYGIYAPFQHHNDYEGKTNLNKKIFVIESGYPSGRFNDYDLSQRVEFAKMRGAVAVIFINSDSAVENPKVDFIHSYKPTGIPVIFAKSDAARLLKNGVVTNCTVGVDIQPIEKKGRNIIGYIDNKASTTVIIGAHYDHLGYGGPESLYEGEPVIHPGADDNASGTAALIELARTLKGSADKNNNYLFIAFSGEEKGLLGSAYFVKHATVDMKTVNYMLNMDMIGRMSNDDKELVVNGTGTSPAFKNILDSAMPGIKIKRNGSGISPSDQVSFYHDSIPVLDFTTGMTSDYHQPSDTEDKINYEGEAASIKIILSVIDRLNNSGKLAFTKAKDDNLEVMPKPRKRNKREH